MSKLAKTLTDLSAGAKLKKVNAELKALKTRLREKEKAQAIDPREPLIRSDLIRRLKRPQRVAALLGHYKCSESVLDEVVRHLECAGYGILREAGTLQIIRQSKPGGGTVLDAHPVKNAARTFGFLSDSHLCNKFARLDVLEAAYDHYAKLGIKQVFHAGNIVDGEIRFNRFELLAHGITDQALYCLDHYPQRKGITTYFITADDHEGWWMQREGIDFGRYLIYEAEHAGRKDLVNVGYMEGDVDIGGDIIRIMHPGGGTAYALSYATQKIVESLQGGEKPGCILVGHYHKSIYHMVRNVHVYQGGTTEDQTVFMRKKKLEAHLGFWTISIRQDDIGAIRSASGEFTAYYDRGYHVGAELEAGK